MRDELPIEPGWYLARSEDVGEVAEWGPRICAARPIAEALALINAWAALHPYDLAVMRAAVAGPRSLHCEQNRATVDAWLRIDSKSSGLVKVDFGRASTVMCSLTQKGHAVLALSGALTEGGC